MTVTEKVARLLIETAQPAVRVVEKDESDGAVEKSADGQLNGKIAVYLNRLLLRLYSVPSLLNALADVGYCEDEANPDQVKIQLDFYRLPLEVFPDVMRLLAAPRPPQAFRYIKNGSARTGFELLVKPEDFPGEEYDYAEAQ